MEIRLIKTSLLAAFFAVSVVLTRGQGVPATATPAAPSTITIIKQEAQNCGRAVLTGDYQSVVRYTHPRIVKKLGGKDAMVSILKTGVAQMRSIGTTIVEVSIGQPEPPKKIGTWLTSIVPQHMVIKVNGGKLYGDSSLLGISEDNGKHWVFVDLGQIGKDEFKQIFPELDGKIKIPAPKEPQFVKDAVPAKQPAKSTSKQPAKQPSKH